MGSWHIPSATGLAPTSQNSHFYPIIKVKPFQLEQEGAEMEGASEKIATSMLSTLQSTLHRGRVLGANLAS